MMEGKQVKKKMTKQNLQKNARNLQTNIKLELRQQSSLMKRENEKMENLFAPSCFQPSGPGVHGIEVLKEKSHQRRMKIIDRKRMEYKASSSH